MTTKRANNRKSQRIDQYDGGSDEDTYYMEPPSACECEKCKFERHVEITPEKIAATEKLLEDVRSKIDENLEQFIAQLGEFIKIKSISLNKDFYGMSIKMMDMVQVILERMGFTVSPITLKIKGDCPNYDNLKLLFASYFSSPTKNTLLIYGSIDVVPTKKSDGWFYEPFVMIHAGHTIFGRGVSKNKGPLVCWLSAIKTWKDLHKDLPINIKFIIEPNSESGSTGMHDILERRRDFFSDVDYILFPSDSWLNDETPIVSCCLTGWAHFGIEVQGGNRVLDSGLAGGMVYEPMIDLCHLMNSLVDDSHDIAVPRIVEMVRSISRNEWDLLESAEFSEYDYKNDLMVRRCRYDISKVTMLKQRWCNTALTMHGIEGIQSGPDTYCAIPMSVMGKFSLKLLPNQDANKTFSAIHDFLQTRHHELNLSTAIQLHVLDWADPVVWTYDSKHTLALVRAMTSVYKEAPALSQMIATCMPIATYIRKVSGKPIILMPTGKRADSRYVTNEFIRVDDFQNIIQLCAALMCELSLLPVKCKCDATFNFCARQGMAEILEQNADGDEGATMPDTKRKKAPPKKKRKFIYHFNRFACWPIKHKRKKY